MSTLLKRSVAGFIAAALLTVCTLLGAGAFTAQNAYADTAAPLTFTANTAGSTITFGWLTVGAGGVEYQASSTSVQYGTANASTTWTAYTENTTITLTNANDWVSFRGDSIKTGGNAGEHFSMTGTIDASGDVTSLTNGSGGNVPLTDECYKFMFAECSSLVTAPNLPSTTLAYQCYYNMFYKCTALTTAPVLPATTLAAGCYECMFEKCSLLTTAPELPATTLATSCYNEMFCDCIGLQEAPELPATTLADSCYMMMFNCCTGLTSPADLSHVVSAGDVSFAAMYIGCSSLIINTEPSDGYEKPWIINIDLAGSMMPMVEAYNLRVFRATNGSFTGDPVAGVTYYIKGNMPKASNFDFTAPTNLTADGTAKVATVTAKNSAFGVGSVSTIYYSADNGTTWNTTAPTEAGTYIVKIDVAAGTGWAAATDVTDSAWTFTVTAAPASDSDSTPAEKAVPDTSDATPIVPVLALAVAAIVGAVLARKRLA